jgi:hypothetical protein
MPFGANLVQSYLKNKTQTLNTAKYLPSKYELLGSNSSTTKKEEVTRSWLITFDVL